jgi:hypothetical protein
LAASALTTVAKSCEILFSECGFSPVLQKQLFPEQLNRPFPIVQIQALAGAWPKGFSEHGYKPHPDKGRISASIKAFDFSHPGLPGQNQYRGEFGESAP